MQRLTKSGCRLVVRLLFLYCFAWSVSSVFAQRAQTASTVNLLDAVRAGNLAVVERIIIEKPELTHQKLNGYPPLHWAVIDQNVDVARFLLASGADVNQQVHGHTPTPIFAAKTAEMAKLLVEHGAKLRIRHEQSGNTPLLEAARNNYVGVVDVLLDAGETLDFDSAVELGRTRLVAEMLSAKPWLAKPPKKPLYYAASQGNLELVKLLLEHGADPDIDFGFANVSGPYTPLTSAVTEGHYEIAELLLRHGASPNVSGGRNHDNLFLFAIAYLDARFTKLMLDHGADLLAGDRWGSNSTPLHVAVALGSASGTVRIGRVGQPKSLEKDDLEVMEKTTYLIEAGADVNARNADGAKPLLFAAIAGHREVCGLLLEQGAELDIGSACLLRRREDVERLLDDTPGLLTEQEQPLGTPVLHWAVRAGDGEIVKLFLRHGAKVDSRAPQLEYTDAGGFSVGSVDGSRGETALHVASSLGYENIVRQLLDQGADIDVKSGERSYLRSAIEMACYGGHTGTIKLLLERGAKVDRDNLPHLFSSIEDSDVLSALMDAAGDVDLKQELGTKLLATAVDNENEVATQWLITRGAQPDLFTACTLGRTEDVKRLLGEVPTLVNSVQPDYPRESALALAVQHGHIDVVRLLIAGGANVHLRESTRGDTLAHEAAAHGHLDVLQLLLENGFSLEGKDDAGATLLHAAASGSQPEIARYLISKGADVNAANFRRETPLHAVGDRAAFWLYDDEDIDDEARRSVTTAKVLIDAGAKVNVKDNYDETPLHSAALAGLAGVAELLLEYGADVNARDFRDDTPLGRVQSWQRHFGRKLTPVAEVLRRYGGVR